MSAFNAYMALSGAADATLVRDERLSRRTGYHIGGPADLVAQCHSYAGLSRVLEVLRAERVEWVILGRGTKVLAADAGYRGCVIVLDGEFARVEVGEDGLVTAGAGALLSKAVFEASRASLTGLEFLSGIPGTVGGAVSLNAGTGRRCVGERVRDLVTLRPGAGLVRYRASDVEWGRHATSLPPDEVILEATFELAPGGREAIDAATRAGLEAMGAVAGSRASCGAVFADPPGRSASVLVGSCGLGGATQGRARVSDEDPNLIVNTGGASADDVVALMGRMHEAVLRRHGIDLACEVKLLGFEG